MSATEFLFWFAGHWAPTLLSKMNVSRKHLGEEALGFADLISRGRCDW